MCVMIGSPGKRIPKNSYVFCIIQYRFSTDEEKWGKSGRVSFLTETEGALLLSKIKQGPHAPHTKRPPSATFTGPEGRPFPKGN